MRLTEIHPAVVTCELDTNECLVLGDAAVEASRGSEGLTEATQLDRYFDYGQEAASQLTCLADFLGNTALHKGPKVVLIHTDEIPRQEVLTPTHYPYLREDGLYPQDAFRAVLLGVANLYGYGFSSQQAGNIHNDIIPIEEYAGINGHNASSKMSLGLHTEVASYCLDEQHDLSPDILTLHFFRNPASVPTTIAIPDFDQMDPERVELLRERWFFNRTSPAQGGEANDPNVAVPVIYGPEDDPWLRVNTSKLDVTRYEDHYADSLLALKSHLESRSFRLDVASGTIAFIDNRRVVHGRTAFKSYQAPKYDGTDRWQRRITAACDPHRIQAFEVQPRVADISKFIQNVKVNLSQKLREKS